ncbi:MaoC/PaaZ C-terminal domain-containing protein [Desulfotruncus alcoholivorax]|uniref:MaoC/PaaZ C-terminal domain-containing protein n=1 Tax=Desulfotruncus alcoholivorax TaxID=265477 RepID=UPI0004218AB1|nr:MaoC/PaaZ C-terminal domain-containing protein [Desulfotruncus alcoholivorax]
MKTEVYFDDFQISDQLPPLTKPPIDQIQLVKYAGASGDFNPLHYMPEIGQMAGTGGVIAHGMLIMGFAGQAVAGWIPNRYLTRFSVRFVGMTKLGDTITVTGTITGKREEQEFGIITGEVIAADQNGEIKLKGTFEASLPKR